MTSRPVIFISAVSKELRSQRDVIAKALRFVGCDPVVQNEFGTEQDVGPGWWMQRRWR